jgi:hypothetical protein
MDGRLLTVSGLLCAFRKAALVAHRTEDHDVTWPMKLAGCRVV